MEEKRQMQDHNMTFVADKDYIGGCSLDPQVKGFLNTNHRIREIYSFTEIRKAQISPVG